LRIFVLHDTSLYRIVTYHVRQIGLHYCTSIFTARQHSLLC